jgi:preprotein translocase SecE subunit
VADKQPDSKVKRVVKNPETFRERALKAAEADDQPGRRSRARGLVGSILLPVFSPIVRTLRKVFGLKVFKPIRKVLHWIGLLIFPRYFRSSWQELKQVTWPGWAESRRLTYAVLVFATVFGATIALVDYGLDKVFKHILLK